MPKRRPPARLPRPVMPDQAQREYFRVLALYAKRYSQLMTHALKVLVPGLTEEAGEELPQVRTDSLRMDGNIEERIRSLFGWVSKQMEDRFSDQVLRHWAKNMVGHVNKTAKANTVKVAKAVDIEAEPLMRDGELSPYFQNVVDENVGLIRSITEGKEGLFKNKLVALITKDAPQDQIREAIAEYLSPQTGEVMNRAAMIARDQVGKLNGALNAYRQQQLGGKGYYWRDSGDGAVRDRHKKLAEMSRKGKVFYWSDPPRVSENGQPARFGNPGDDYQCRCHAEMYLGDVLE